MNDNDTTSLPGMPPSAAKSRSHKKTYALWIVFFLFVLAGVAAVACRHWRDQQAQAPQNLTEIQQRLTGLENSVRALDERVNALNLPTVATGPSANEAPAQNAAASQQSTADIARLQSDLVALSSALAALQNEVKETTSHAQHSQQATQSMLASAIAYIQLRATATTNQPFAAELSAMRDASLNDGDFQQALGRLQPIAATGAPTILELREELMTLEASALQAIDQHAAQNWWQKFVAEIKGLVSVRKLHGGDVDAFGTMENDLAKNDLLAAIDHLKSLPPEAQNVLSDWRGKAEARQTVTEALHNLAEHFNALAKTPAQGEP